MGNVGGDPHRMSGGAATLHDAGTSVHAAGAAVGHQVTALTGATGAADLEAACRRLAAALGTAVSDTGVEVVAAAQLAANASADLHAAGGD